MSEVDYTRVLVAEVYKQDRLCGSLRRLEGGDVAFAYAPEYLSEGGPPVATTLPLSDAPVVAVGGAVPKFFAGLLPEGARMELLRAHVRTSADDMLSLLLAVGADTVGDVRIFPAGVDVADASGPRQVRDFRDVSFVDLLAESAGATGAPDAVALPGVQDKFSASMVAFPTATESGAYIVKLTPARYRRLVANEHTMLRIAAEAKLDVAQARIVTDRQGEEGLLVSRFDRLVRDGVVVRAEQEDGCQLLGLYPADKYRVGAEQLIGAVARTCTSPVLAARELLRLFVCSYAIGNGDLHAKNVSVRTDPVTGLRMPTPAYDVVATTPYGFHDQALIVEGRRDGLTRARWLALAEKVGVPEKAARRVIEDVVDGVERSLDLLDDIGFDPAETRTLRRTIERRLTHLAM